MHAAPPSNRQRRSTRLRFRCLSKAGIRPRVRPKHWREFSEPGASVFDFVFTLSDTASREAFPDWPGKPVSSHWRYPDPLKATGDEWQRRREFERTLAALERQMRVFMQLPLARLDAIALKTHLNEIGIEQAEASDAQTS
jgi:arsenate reductase (thioredoxin)